MQRASSSRSLGPEEVIARLGLRGRRDLNELLQRAKGLVAVTVSRVGREPALDRELADRLVAALGLDNAYVAHADAATLAGQEYAHERDARWAASTGVHEALGQAAGDYLLTRVRHGDKIGVCGGRAAGFTAQHVEEKLRREANAGPRVQRSAAEVGVGRRYQLDGEVYSLGGGSFLEAVTRGDRLRLFIADYNAHMLAEALTCKRFLCAARAYRAKGSRDIIFAEDAPHLVDPELVLDIAVYGVTVVDADHYVVRMRDDDPQGQAISRERAALARIIEEVPAVVIDYCERFYATSETPPEHEQDVRGIVGGLNEQVVSVDPAVLGRARERILVAGGEAKLRALVEVTGPTWTGPRPTTLITDSQTARALLETTQTARG